MKDRKRKKNGEMWRWLWHRRGGGDAEGVGGVGGGSGDVKGREYREGKKKREMGGGRRSSHG